MPGKVRTTVKSPPDHLTPRQPKRSQTTPTKPPSPPLFSDSNNREYVSDDESSPIVSHTNAPRHSENSDRPKSERIDNSSARPRRVRIDDHRASHHVDFHNNNTPRGEDEELGKDLTKKLAVVPDDDSFTPKRRFPIISSLCIMTSCFFAALLIDTAAVLATTQFASTVLLVGGFSAIPFVGQITLAVVPFVIGALILLNRKYNIVDYFLTKTDLGKKISDSKIYKWTANTWIGKFITWASYKPIVPFASPEADSPHFLSPNTYR